MKKVCDWCGEVFDARGTQRYCSRPHYAECEVCGKSFQISSPASARHTCSAECQSILRKQSISSNARICELCGKSFVSSGNTAKYCPGPHYAPCPVCQKPVLITQTYNPNSCCSTECSTKLREQTCLATWGVKVVSQAAEVRDKLRHQAKEATMQRMLAVQQHYGAEYTNVSQVPEIRDKI